MSLEQQSDSVDADESQDRSSSSRVSDKEQDPETDDSDDEGKTPALPPQSSREESGPNLRSSRSDFAAAEDNPRCQPNGQGASGQGGTAMAGPGSVESNSNSLFSMLQSRTIRRGLFVDPSRDNFRTMTNLYSSMSPAADSVNLNTQTHGAVFNLEYSPDGSVLTVACEQTEVLLFDPISSKHIKTLVEAHEDCVNNIRFLDNRLFATCSDDTTIALWDLRKLNSKVCSLHGHASWVKNIEYDTSTRLLVTSGFDGNVITWDTNRFTEDGCPHKKFFHTRYLMRMRLTPDCSKMLISTSSGYLLILHDLDLTQSLEVGSYRMLRARRTPLSPDGSASASRSSGAPRQGNDSSKIHPHREGLSPRNSLEVLTPEIPGERDRGNCITSLQLHPKGWAALIRCSSNMDDQEVSHLTPQNPQEWTCVYEFQDGSPTRPPVSPRCSLRLTHYIEEANVGRGYIKELCFSPDGRLICSPYGYGVRLLSFDENCMELSDCLPVQTSCLREVRSIYSHSDVVLTTKFSPTHCQLASGCLSGRVALYQPRF
ncbi:DDB1- and CUL4-associated factor 10 isoform X1 [Coregonus clupeaformis]|uniref:DDB1- and CUL4-associated factor 10 isoform X1 n=1 Tax=Coregonus clupeaformis TaxID=59861 RepID=UPI001E1C4033|nr:DDB1- and CUL4-associated factor 10 isoform X1 [Coregonus clupeaformis]